MAGPRTALRPEGLAAQTIRGRQFRVLTRRQLTFVTQAMKAQDRRSPANGPTR